MPRQRSRNGFSLVELSIVLVILGLLVGGVLSGQALIRAAELRAVTTEYERYFTATRSFRDKYFAVPGDMANATAFWGAADPTPATCLTTTTATGTQTCNGNGDGAPTLPAAATQYGELYTFWQHLANAGLIEGTYTGRAGAAQPFETTTANAPKSKISNGLWYVSNDVFSGGLMFPAAVARTNFRLGGAITGSWARGKAITPSEMWNIDTKMDDGLPALGKVTGPKSSYVALGDCVTDDTLAAQYELTLSSKECILIMDTGI